MTQRLLSRVRRCLDDFNMIKPGDRITVGISGGKDSLVTLWALSELRRFYPIPYELEAATISMGFDGMSFDAIDIFCRSIGVKYTVVNTEIKQIIFDIRKESNPCALCAKMRRGSLNDTAISNGSRTIALGHHFDDAVETFMMSLIFEGRMSCFQPVTWLDRKEVTVIRPMLYVGEKMMRNVAETLELPIVHSTCPADGNTKRQEIKELLSSLQQTYPDIKSKVFGAICRAPLTGWKRTGLPLSDFRDLG